MNCTCQPRIIRDPNQRDLFTQTQALESYARGYESGVTWDANWMPGGPHTYTNHHDRYHPRYAEFAEMERVGKEKYTAWHEGFKDGLALRLQNRRFAAWWHEHRNRNGHFRYYDKAEHETV